MDGIAGGGDGMIFRNEISMKFGKLHRGDKCLVRGEKAIYLGSYRNKKRTAGEPWIHLMRMEGAGIPIIVEVRTTSDIACEKNGVPATSNQMGIMQ